MNICNSEAQTTCMPCTEFGPTATFANQVVSFSIAVTL